MTKEEYRERFVKEIEMQILVDEIRETMARIEAMKHFNEIKKSLGKLSD